MATFEQCFAIPIVYFHPSIFIEDSVFSFITALYGCCSPTLQVVSSVCLAGQFSLITKIIHSDDWLEKEVCASVGSESCYIDQSGRQQGDRLEWQLLSSLLLHHTSAESLNRHLPHYWAKQHNGRASSVSYLLFLFHINSIQSPFNHFVESSDRIGIRLKPGRIDRHGPRPLRSQNG